MGENMTKFSADLALSFTKLYRAGGLALVFVFVGVITMLVGHFHASGLSSWIFAIGAVVTLTSLGLFIYLQLIRPVQAIRVSRRDKEMTDAIEEIALEMTRTIAAIQALTFKYIERVNRILDAIIPLLSLIPGVNRKLDEAGISDARSTSRVIVDICTQIERIVLGTKQALINKDSKKLMSYSSALREATEELNKALAAPK